MTNDFYLKTRKFLSVWYPIFTSICLVNILLHFFFDFGGEIISVFIIPFLHFFLILIFWFYIIYKEHKEAPIDFGETRNSSKRYLQTEDGYYLYHSHPEIWNELTKKNPNRIDMFAIAKFKQGGYDDGSDNQLNLIKKKLRYIPFIALYPFLLIIASWLLGVIVILVKGI